MYQRAFPMVKQAVSEYAGSMDAATSLEPLVKDTYGVTYNYATDKI